MDTKADMERPAALVVSKACDAKGFRAMIALEPEVGRDNLPKPNPPPPEPPPGFPPSPPETLFSLELPSEPSFPSKPLFSLETLSLLRPPFPLEGPLLLEPPFPPEDDGEARGSRPRPISRPVALVLPNRDQRFELRSHLE